MPNLGKAPCIRSFASQHGLRVVAAATAACLIQCSSANESSPQPAAAGTVAGSFSVGGAGAAAAGTQAVSAPGPAIPGPAAAGTAALADSPQRRLPPPALITGVCEVLRLAPDPTMCTGVDDFLGCVNTQCKFEACAATCQAEIACAVMAPDPCMEIGACPRSDECLLCMNDVQICGFATHCNGMITCSTPTQGGACQRLAACCDTQRNPENCAGLIEILSMVRGDAECESAMSDPKFREIYLSDPPCMAQ